MSLRVITPPVHPPVSIGEAKAHLRVTNSEEDATIAGFVRAATAALDGPEGSLGRCLIATTLELTADWFLPSWCAGIRLPCPPLIEVLSVSYVDHDGAEQLVEPATYQVCGVGDQGRLVLAYGASWPSARHRLDAVRIVYRAGYGETWNDVPEHLREAVLLLMGTMFNQRETTVEAGTFETGAAQRLYMPSKVYLP